MRGSSWCKHAWSLGYQVASASDSVELERFEIDVIQDVQAFPDHPDRTVLKPYCIACPAPGRNEAHDAREHTAVECVSL